MTSDLPPPFFAMAPALIDRLSRYAVHDRRPGGGTRPHRPELWAFVAHDRERLNSVRIDRTILVAVLEGAKELAETSGAMQRFAAGDVMMLPPGWSGSIVNEPDGTTGLYRALVLEFPAGMVRRLFRAHGTAGNMAGNMANQERRRRPHGLGVAMTRPLADAIQHAAAGLAAGEGIGPRIVEHRCMEVLLALLDGGVWWLGSRPAAGGIADAVRHLVAAQPDRPWTADSVARALNLSAGTLRRRLAAEDSSVRRILTEERLAHARHLLETEGLSVQEAAEACGYASRSHFARRVRAATGVNPSGLRGELRGD